MRGILLFLVLCLTLMACSNEKEVTGDILSNVAEFNFQQSFDLKDEKTISMFVEVYEYGKFKDNKYLSFSNNYNGKGAIQFSLFRQNFTPDLFLIGAIQDKKNILSEKRFLDSPKLGLIFKAAKNKVITQTGEYRLGMYGSVPEVDATTYITPLHLTVEKRNDFIEAYEKFPIIYVVVVAVRDI
jgi:hypothetical protein